MPTTRDKPDDKPPNSGSRARTRTPPKDSDKPKPRTPTDKKLAASITGSYEMVGTLLTGIGLRIDDAGLSGTGVATVNNAEMLAEAWMDVADQNPKVKVTLKRLTEVSTIGVLVSLHLATIMPLLMDRGVVPPAFAATTIFTSPNGDGSTSE